jgi:hypothetical protein
MSSYIRTGRLSYGESFRDWPDHFDGKAKKEKAKSARNLDLTVLRVVENADVIDIQRFQMQDKSQAGYLVEFKVPESAGITSGGKPATQLQMAIVHEKSPESFRMYASCVLDDDKRDAAALKKLLNVDRSVEVIKKGWSSPELRYYDKEHSKNAHFTSIEGKAAEQIFQRVTQVIAGCREVKDGVIDDYYAPSGRGGREVSSSPIGTILADPERLIVVSKPGPPVGDDLLGLLHWNGHLVALTSVGSGKDPVQLCVRKVDRDAPWIVVPMPKGMSGFPHKAAGLGLRGSNARIWGGRDADGKANDSSFEIDLREVLDLDKMPLDPAKLWTKRSGAAGEHPVIVQREAEDQLYGAASQKEGGGYEFDVDPSVRPTYTTSWLGIQSKQKPLVGASPQVLTDGAVFGPDARLDGTLRFSEMKGSESRDHVRLKTLKDQLPAGLGMGTLLIDYYTKDVAPATYLGGVGPKGLSTGVWVHDNLLASSQTGWRKVGECEYTGGMAKVVRVGPALWASVMVTPAGFDHTGSALYFLVPKPDLTKRAEPLPKIKPKSSDLDREERALLKELMKDDDDDPLERFLDKY